MAAVNSSKSAYCWATLLLVAQDHSRCVWQPGNQEPERCIEEKLGQIYLGLTYTTINNTVVISVYLNVHNHWMAWMHSIPMLTCCIAT